MNKIQISVENVASLLRGDETVISNEMILEHGRHAFEIAWGQAVEQATDGVFTAIVLASDNCLWRTVEIVPA